MSRKSLSLLVVCGFVLGFGIAHADDAGLPGVTVIADAGSGSAVTPAAAPTPPSATLPNPVDDPLAVIDTVRLQKKQGWAPAILACIVMLTAGFSRAAAKWPSSKLLAWFAKNKTAIFLISGLSVTSAAAFNALALGGTWMAAAYAAVVAGASLLRPGTPAPQPNAGKA
jgi:hypothetical protein